MVTCGCSCLQQARDYKHTGLWPVANSGNEWAVQPSKITGWWFGTFFIFPYIGNFIIPIDFHIFQRGGPTTNQTRLVSSHVWCLISLMVMFSMTTDIQSMEIRANILWTSTKVYTYIYYIYIYITYSEHIVHGDQPPTFITWSQPDVHAVLRGTTRKQQRHWESALWANLGTSNGGFLCTKPAFLGHHFNPFDRFFLACNWSVSMFLRMHV